VNTPAPLPPAQPQAITHYENFPVASWLCPSHLRAPIAAIYAFARTADDLADEGPASPAERLHDLAAYRADLQARAAGTAPSARWPEVFAPLAGVLRSHHLPVPLLDDLLSAFIQDVEKTRDARATPPVPSCWTTAAAPPTPWAACCCTCTACTARRPWPRATPSAPPCSSSTSGRT
jgi:phytoene/squalene synthetase